MRYFTVGLLIAAVVIVECSHTFIGTSVQRQLVLQRTVQEKPKTFQKTITTANITIPYSRLRNGFIEGILAYDVTNSGASANVTAGGVGFSFVNLRMKSDRGKKLHYEVYIYG
ncbi:unnamed protein product, partial [Iphiclides podalirius]